MNKRGSVDLFGIFALFALVCFFVFIGLRIAGKYQLCKNYYSEMNTLACMASDVIMPPQRK